MEKSTTKTYSVYQRTLDQIAEIVGFLRIETPTYGQSNVIREAVDAYYKKLRNKIEDHKYEKGGLNG